MAPAINSKVMRSSTNRRVAKSPVSDIGEGTAELVLVMTLLGMGAGSAAFSTWAKDVPETVNRTVSKQADIAGIRINP